MIYLILFFEYFKIGLFSVGGGLATLPFVIDLANKYGWINNKMIADMVAISESTPGPLGVNIATYVGFQSCGIFGGLVATIGLITPSVIIVILVAGLLEKFKNNNIVQGTFEGLRPASIGLIGLAAYEVVKIALLNLDLYKITNNIKDIVDIKRLIFFVVIFYGILKYKKHPVMYIGIAMVVGVVFKM